MAGAQFETSIANNSPSQDSSHPDDHFQSKYVTPGFKPISFKNNGLAASVSCIGFCNALTIDKCQKDKKQINVQIYTD